MQKIILHLVLAINSAQHYTVWSHFLSEIFGECIEFPRYRNDKSATRFKSFMHFFMSLP